MTAPSHTPRSFTLRAPGKMMWLGEYAVLHGAPAVVAAVNRRGVARWEPGGDHIALASSYYEAPLHVGCPGGLASATGAPNAALADAVFETLRQAQVALPEAAGTLHLDTDALKADDKLGLGSSGAVAALIAGAFGALSGCDAATIEALALRGHDAFQGGVGSGSDVYASLHGGVLHVQHGTPTRALRSPDGLRCGVLYTGVSADTRTMVRAMHAWRAAEPGSADGIFAALAEAARAGVGALDAGDVGAWLDVVAEYRALETALTHFSGVPIVSPAVQRCIDAARDAGFVAKPSGAGGGDIVVAFGGENTCLSELNKVADHSDLHFVDVAIEPSGVLQQASDVSSLFSAEQALDDRA